MKRILLCSVLLGIAGLPYPHATACSTILAGQQATADGSVFMSHSCDGDVMGLVYVMPAQSYPPGTRLPMYWNVPRPRTYEEYQANLRKGYDQVGTLPVSETYRSLILAGNLESMTTGGLNEHGVSIAIEFLPMRKGLANGKGRVGPNSNHWTTSLIANGLLRAKTAREAIRLIGAMIEEYGFLYYRAPSAGVALPIADGHEAWLMEIFGNLLWFAYGPADTSCFVPLYAGVTDLPDLWDHPANFTRIDRWQPQWNFRLVHNLTHRLPHQKATKEVHAMIKPAEQRHLDFQPDLERAAVDVFRKRGPKAAEALLAAYAPDCVTRVGSAYAELVDYLMLRFLVGDPELAHPTLPRIAPPTLPQVEPRETR